MWEAILGIFTSGAFSAIFGGITALAQLWLKKKHEKDMMKQRIEEKKLELDHDINMLKLETEGVLAKAKLETDAQKFIATEEKETAINVGEINSVIEAMSHDKASYANKSKLGKFGNFLFVIVDFIRGTIRPVITIYSMIIMNYMLIKLIPQIDVLSIDQKNSLLLLIFNAVVYISVKSIVYWFGDRGKEIIEMIKNRK